MPQSFGNIIIGGLLTIVGIMIGAISNHIFESRRRKTSELRQEKIKIYTNFLTEIPKSIDKEYINRIYNKSLNKQSEIRMYKIELRNKYKRIFSPAMRIASDDLFDKLMILFHKHTEFITTLVDTKNKSDEDMKKLIEEASQALNIVEYEMRRELKKL